MKEEAATDAELRQFLLGTVEDEERQRIERLFLTDPQTRERLLAVEQELIDDYVEDCLSMADRESFLFQYGDTAAQRRRLRIAKSIQEWAANQPTKVSVPLARATSIWGRLFAELRLKPILIIPIAATTAVAIVIAFVWVNSRRGEQERQHFAIEQELAQLNTPSSLREVPPATAQLILKPGSMRSVETEPELTIRSDNPFAELRLLWMQPTGYPGYRAIVRPAGHDQSYTIPNLQTENEDQQVIKIRLPAHLLTRGTCQVQLIGVSADGKSSPPEAYSFTVSK